MRSTTLQKIRSSLLQENVYSRYKKPLSIFRPQKVSYLKRPIHDQGQSFLYICTRICTIPSNQVKVCDSLSGCRQHLSENEFNSKGNFNSKEVVGDACWRERCRFVSFVQLALSVPRFPFSTRFPCSVPCFTFR